MSCKILKNRMYGKGEFYKIKWSICNIQIKDAKIFIHAIFYQDQQFPMASYSKQERGLKCRDHVYFEPVTYSVKCCTYVTIYLNFDLNSEVSNKEVIAFYRLGKIC